MKVILLTNGLGKYTPRSMSIKKFNKKYQEIFNDNSVEYLLIPMSQYSDVYAAVPKITLPNKFKPITIKYRLVLYELTQDYASLINTQRGIPNNEILSREYVVVCNTIYEFYTFVFSIIKLMAYNELQNVGRFKPGIYKRRLIIREHNYAFYISDMECLIDGQVTELLINNTSLGNAISSFDKLNLSSIPNTSNMLGISPSIYKFYFIEGDPLYNIYTDVHKLKEMRGPTGVVTNYLLRSCACEHYNAYAFVSPAMMSEFKYIHNGRVTFIMFTYMGDRDMIDLDSQFTIADLLTYPEYAAVHKVEEYELLTPSDFIEMAVFAGDMLNMMRTVSDIVGDEFKNCECMMQIEGVFDSDGGPYQPVPFAYTVTDTQISSGEIEDVLADFMNYMATYFDKNIPF